MANDPRVWKEGSVRRALVGLMLATYALVSIAQEAFVPEKSELTFTVRQMGVNVQGRFTRFSGQVAFDPKRAEAAHVELSIDTASATLGVADIDGELGKPDWFAVASYPRARFKSTAVKTVAPGKYEVSGDLTIKSITRPVVVPIAVAVTPGAMVATGTFVIRRNDFNVGEREWRDTGVVADPVQVNFKLHIRSAGT